MYSKLLILGSGPAGYTASIYSARANLNPVLISGDYIGGQLTNTSEVENWPGEYNGILGSLLMKRMESHALKFGVKIVYDHIVGGNLNVRPFLINGRNHQYSCDALIIATGSSVRHLGLLSENKFKGKGISYCAVCDGFFYKNKIVVVIGGGNTAIEEAIYLSNIASKVYVVHRRNEFRAEKILVDRLMKKVDSNEIILYNNNIVRNIIGNDEEGVTGILIEDVNNKSISNLKVDGIFVAIGYIPNSDIFSNQLLLRKNHIFVNFDIMSNVTSTSIKGVFAAGDVMDNNYRQAITSAGFGCMAALDAERYLNIFINK